MSAPKMTSSQGPEFYANELTGDALPEWIWTNPAQAINVLPRNSFGWRIARELVLNDPKLRHPTPKTFVNTALAVDVESAARAKSPDELPDTPMSMPREDVHASEISRAGTISPTATISPPEHISFRTVDPNAQALKPVRPVWMWPLNRARNANEIVVKSLLSSSKPRITMKEESDFTPNEWGVYERTSMMSFVPPKGNVTFPLPHQLRSVIMFNMRRAILNTHKVQDNTKPKWFDMHWSRDARDKFKPWQVDAMCAKIVDRTVSLHEHGFKSIMFDRELRANLNANLTFEGRINALLVLFSQWKSVCDTVMKDEKIMAYILGPIAYWRRTGANKRNNNNRKTNEQKLRGRLSDVQDNNSNNSSQVSTRSSREPSVASSQFVESPGTRKALLEQQLNRSPSIDSALSDNGGENPSTNNFSMSAWVASHRKDMVEEQDKQEEKSAGAVVDLEDVIAL